MVEIISNVSYHPKQTQTKTLLLCQPALSVVNSGSSCTQGTTSVAPNCKAERSNLQKALSRKFLTPKNKAIDLDKKPGNAIPQDRNGWGYTKGRPTGWWVWRALDCRQWWPNVASQLASPLTIVSVSLVYRWFLKLVLKYNQVINVW